MRLMRNNCSLTSYVMANHMISTKGCFTYFLFTAEVDRNKVKAEATAFVKDNTLVAQSCSSVMIIDQEGAVSKSRRMGHTPCRRDKEQSPLNHRNCFLSDTLLRRDQYIASFLDRMLTELQYLQEKMDKSYMTTAKRKYWFRRVQHAVDLAAVVATIASLVVAHE